jgi:hypothetical protein
MADLKKVSGNPGDYRIKLSFGFPGKVLWEEFIDAFRPLPENEDSKGEAKSETESQLISQSWAQKHLAFLIENTEAQANPDPKKKDPVLQISRKYSLVTPKSAFIVLQDLSEYVKHQIKPPKSLPVILREYLALKKTLEQKKEWILEEKMKSLVHMWIRKFNSIESSGGSALDTTMKNNLLHFSLPDGPSEKWNDPFWTAVAETDFLFEPEVSKRSWHEAFHSEDEIRPWRMQRVESGRKPVSYSEGTKGNLRKVIPVPTEPADYNYLGMLIGPRGLTKKQLESETGARLNFLGTNFKFSIN